MNTYPYGGLAQAQSMECPILKACRHALDDAIVLARANPDEWTPRLRAEFVAKRLRIFDKPEFSLAAALIDRIFEPAKCHACGREK